MSPTWIRRRSLRSLASRKAACRRCSTATATCVSPRSPATCAHSVTKLDSPRHQWPQPSPLCPASHAGAQRTSRNRQSPRSAMLPACQSARASRRQMADEIETTAHCVGADSRFGCQCLAVAWRYGGSASVEWGWRLRGRVRRSARGRSDHQVLLVDRGRGRTGGRVLRGSGDRAEGRTTSSRGGPARPCRRPR